MQVVKPTPWPVIAYAKAWSPGTNGVTTADATLAVLPTDADLEKFKGKLKGKIVLLQAVKEVAPIFAAPARRYEEKDLDDMSRQQVGRGVSSFGTRCSIRVARITRVSMSTIKSSPKT